MSTVAARALPNRRRKPLAVCLAGILSLAAPAALAGSVFVTNCNDAGAGSLRGAVAAAADGDTVDATGLAGVCSTITLKTGEIVVGQNNLTIQGPGRSALTLTALYFNGVTFHQYPYRIFHHTGAGTLAIESLSMFKGYQPGVTSAAGGCVYSNGSVSLYKVGLYTCRAAASLYALGGGSATAGNTFVKYSVISGNTAYAGGSYGGSKGGGVLAANGFTAKYSTIRGNYAAGASGVYGLGGAVFAYGNTVVRGSTIEGNSAGRSIGGLALLTSGSTTSAVITESTISGNRAMTGLIGGLYTSTPNVSIYNSTIAFNQAAAASSGSYAVGVVMTGSGAGTTVTLESTLVANNTYGSSSDDLSTHGTVTITGNNNLVRVSSASLPGDTIAGHCPILGPLQFNGGSTKTHALLSHSPGIDQGNNLAALGFDQRGSPDARVSGPAADIGAYELQQNAIVFNANFEGCP